jgi:hypothetical protein
MSVVAVFAKKNPHPNPLSSRDFQPPPEYRERGKRGNAFP